MSAIHRYSSGPQPSAQAPGESVLRMRRLSSDPDAEKHSAGARSHSLVESRPFPGGCSIASVFAKVGVAPDTMRRGGSSVFDDLEPLRLGFGFERLVDDEQVLQPCQSPGAVQALVPDIAESRTLEQPAKCLDDLPHVLRSRFCRPSAFMASIILSAIPPTRCHTKGPPGWRCPARIGGARDPRFRDRRRRRSRTL